VWLSFLTKEIERKLKYIYVLKSSQEKMLTLVVSLVLCSQCVGNSEGLANLDNSQQRIGGSKRNSEDLVNAKLHQQNAEDSGQSMEKLLEVVEVEPVKPVLHGTIVRLTLQDGSCHLRMSSNKYPVKHSNGAGSSHQYAVGCADAGGAGGDGGAGANAEGRSNLWQMINYAELEDIYEPDSPVVIRQNASIYLISWSLSPGGALLNTHTVAAPFSKNSQEVSGYVNYNIGMEPDVVWRVILPPGENFWRVGSETGVRLQHVTTGKLLTVTSHRYPEPWGEGMREVIAASASVGDGAKAGWTINYYQLPDMAEELTEQAQEELYGGGTSEKTISSLQAQKNTASSTTGLRQLLKAEWALLAMLGKHQEVFDFVQEVLLTDGFSLTSIYNSDVRHPVDGYNLIKRLARSWPKARDALLAKKEVVSEMVMVELEEALHQFPSWEENRVSCAVGLLNIQIYSGLDPTDLIGGKIVDPASGKTFKAATKLTPRDAELVAKVAEEQRRFDAKVSWLAASPQLRKKYKKAVTQHNQLLEDPELLVRKEIHTFPESVDHSIAFARNLTQLLHIGRQNCKPFEATDTGSCISYFYWPEVRQLCQGSEKGLRPAQYDKDTKCELLLMSDPYLRLGPFLLEHKNKAGNYIAQIHDIVSPLEMEAIKQKTHKRMKATPYSIANKNVDFSYERTSKVHYLSERTDNLTFELTKRLELALGFKMYQPGRPYASENYQIMNYGIGGKINLHFDTFDKQSDLGIGGGRFTTAMFYLSNVEAGGRTIFPKLGISVEPEAGSLLYWHLRRSDGSTDSRMSHLGCPVLFGDKWIGNKWVRWQEQISTFKCFLPKGTNFEPNDRVVLRQKYSLFQ